MVVHRALPSVEQDMCVWQAESSGKGGQEQAAFPPSPARLQHPSIWQGQVGSAVCTWQVRCFSRSCRPVPCLLCLHSVSWLQTRRHLIFQQPHFSTGTGLENLLKLAELNLVPGPALSFHFSLYCKHLESALVLWFTACSPCPGTAGLPPPYSSVLHECWCNEEAVPVVGTG